jgi:hypothetical protein
MKSIFILSISSIMFLSSNVFASTSKICFGSTKDDTTKGVVLQVDVNKKEITVKTIKGGFDHNDTYPTYGTVVNGRDGQVYREYQGDSSDYQEVVMADQELFKKGTSGLLQFRARGEGFFNAVFVCKDSDL